LPLTFRWLTGFSAKKAKASKQARSRKRAREELAQLREYKEKHSKKVSFKKDDKKKAK
jgi:hypothetical protein